MRREQPPFAENPDRRPVCGRTRWRQILSYIGPGFLVTVGFIDPGNWATDIAAGSHYNYDLLWVVALGTGILILWQHIAAHLGIVTGKCLAEGVRQTMKPGAVALYGLTAMGAGIATALAEILGGAIGLNLLFHVPIRLGAFIIATLVGLMIWLQRYSTLEKLIVGFVGAIGFAYLVELYLVKPDWHAVALHSVVPTLNSGSVLVAIGVLGAVVMPHNMYLHSEVIQTRQWEGMTQDDTHRLLRFEFLDTLLAMLVGMAINSAIIIMAAAVFFRHGIHVTELAQASATLVPIAGRLASFIFGIALLSSGISSSLTAGIAGGTIVSGYMGHETDLENRWFRAGMILTLVPAALLILVIRDTFTALIISQVCLSLQLPLTMLPLFLLTNSRRVMGGFANSGLERTLLVFTGLLVVFLNVLLLYSVFGGRF